VSCFRSGIGDTASGKHGEDYARTYDGKVIELGPHLRIGTKPLTGIRIYWWVDFKQKTFVIGHVGAKLGDRSNP
jgi:hypothetical protein